MKLVAATLITILSLSSFQAKAFETNGGGSTVLSTFEVDGGGSRSSANMPHKIVKEAANYAKDDIYMYVATEGKQVNANLLDAIATVRRAMPEMNDQQAFDVMFEALR
jgi:hypothetical protein